MLYVIQQYGVLLISLFQHQTYFYNFHAVVHYAVYAFYLALLPNLFL